MKPLFAKLHLKQRSQAPDDSSRRERRGGIAAVALLTASVLLVISVGSFAWLSGTMEKTKIEVDSGGLDGIGAEFFYVEAFNSNRMTLQDNGMPTEDSYVSQDRFSLRTVSSQSEMFYVDSTLYYKMKVTNGSDKKVTLSLSFEDLDRYYTEAATLYAEDQSANNSAMTKLLEAYSGLMLMQMDYVRYRYLRSDGVTDELTEVPQQSGQAYPVSLCELSQNIPFLSGVTLDAGQVIEIYFAIRCINPYTASVNYMAYRNRMLAEMAADTSGKYSVDYQTAYSEIMTRELQRLVATDGGQSFNIQKVGFRIDAISLVAKQITNTPDGSGS